MAADDGEATALVASMPQPEGEGGLPPVAVEAGVARQEEEEKDEQSTMAADASPPPQQQQQQPEEEGEQPIMAADAVVAPTPLEEKEEDEQPTMDADAVDAPMPPPPPQQQPEEEGEQPTMAADPVVALTPPQSPPEEEKGEDEQPTMAAEAVVVSMPPPPPQPEEEEEVGQPTMAADAVIVPIPPPPSKPEEKDKEEDEQPVAPAALPQPLESGPVPTDKGDEEASQAKKPFKVPYSVDEGDMQMPEGKDLCKFRGTAEEEDKETWRDKNPLHFLGPTDERDKAFLYQSPEDDCHDYRDRYHQRHLGVPMYSKHRFCRGRYPMDCYPSYHDNTLHYVNGYLDRNCYPGHRHIGYPFGPYDHDYRNQYRPMNPLHDKRIYDHTTCCSRNLICGKKGWPVGASLSNPEKWICFLNCILQCVVHTVPLVLKLLEQGHPGLCRSGSDEFCCYCSLRHHASEVIRLSGDVLYPRKFVKFLKLVFQDFERGQHQDAHEFLRCLLDKLDEASVASMSSSEEPSSIVKEIFGGQLKSQLHCPECNHCSDRLESFLDLNLEINQMESVMDSLRSFTKIEVVEDFICDGCKSRVNMEKRLKVEQAPEVLVIQLKRFQNLGCNISKIHDMVKYELELDLNPFMSSPDDKPQNYDLYGVVEHLGNTYKGHYVCYIRSSETDWFLFDDEKVIKMTEDRLLDNKAYLLFYVKQGSSPWFSTLLERKDVLLAGYLQELLDEGLDENCILIDSDEGSYSGSDSGSDEQDTAARYFCGLAEKNKAGPSSAGLSQGVQGNANVITMFSVSDRNGVSCNLGGPSGETQNHSSLLPSSVKNWNCGGLELVVWNKENFSTQGSHGSGEMSHRVHGQVHDAGSHGGSSRENGRSCNILQPSAHKHEDNCCPENLTLHKDGMRGSCDSSGSPRARKRISTSRSRTVGPNSDRTTKDDVAMTGGRKLMKTGPVGATRGRKRMKTRFAGAAKAKKQKRDASLKILPWKTRSAAAAWAARGRAKRKRR